MIIFNILAVILTSLMLLKRVYGYFAEENSNAESLEVIFLVYILVELFCLIKF